MTSYEQPPIIRAAQASSLFAAAEVKLAQPVIEPKV